MATSPPRLICGLCRKPIAPSSRRSWCGMGMRDAEERVHEECGERAAEEQRKK